MRNQHLIVTGSWVDAIGQLTSAVGATQQITQSADFYQRLIVIGDGLQSVGNALQGLGETDPLGAKGDWIQTAGAGTASVGAALNAIGTVNQLYGLKKKRFNSIGYWQLDTSYRWYNASDSGNEKEDTFRFSKLKVTMHKTDA